MDSNILDDEEEEEEEVWCLDVGLGSDDGCVDVLGSRVSLF